MPAAPLSYRRYPGNGSTVLWSVPFPFLLRAHVHLYLGYDLLTGSFLSELAEGAGFQWETDSLVRTTAPVATGATLTIIRKTPTGELLVQWQNGSDFIGDQLQQADLQTLYALQEQQDITALSAEEVRETVDTANAASAVANQAAQEALAIADDAETALAQSSAAVATANQAAASAGSIAGNAQQALQQSTQALQVANAAASTFVSVLEYGAIGDGSFDCTPAFNAAIAAAQGIRSSVYVPPGVYFLSGTLNWSNKFVDLRGAGRGVTVLAFGAVSVGINIDNSQSYYSVDISHITIATYSPTPTGTAIRIRWPESFFGRMIHKGSIRGVQIEGYDGTSAGNTTRGWLRGIHYTQALFVAIDDCGILGRDTGGPDSNTQASKTASETGILFDGGAYPCDIRVTNSFVNCWDTGFRAAGSPEGLQFRNYTSLQCRVNIHAEPTTFTGGADAKFRPQLVVSDSHMSCYQSNIISNGMVNGYIHHNLFYALPAGLQAAEMLQIMNAVDVTAESNTFQSYSQTQNVTGIAVSDVIVGTGIELRNNAFGPMWKGIHIKPSAYHVRTAKNRWLLAPSESFGFAALHDQGIATVFDREVTHLTIAPATVLSLPSGAYTAIAWDSELADNAGFWTSGSRLTNPGKGVRRVQLTAQVYLTAPGGGAREIVVAKNGQKDFAGTAATRLNPVTESQVVMNISTPIIALEPSQYLEVLVYHTSSGAAVVDNYLGRTHVSLQIIE